MYYDIVLPVCLNGCKNLTDILLGVLEHFQDEVDRRPLKYPDSITSYHLLFMLNGQQHMQGYTFSLKLSFSTGLHLLVAHYYVCDQFRDG